MCELTIFLIDVSGSMGLPISPARETSIKCNVADILVRNLVQRLTMRYKDAGFCALHYADTAVWTSERILEAADVGDMLIGNSTGGLSSLASALDALYGFITQDDFAREHTLKNIILISDGSPTDTHDAIWDGMDKLAGVAAFEGAARIAATFRDDPADIEATNEFANSARRKIDINPAHDVALQIVNNTLAGG